MLLLWLIRLGANIVQHALCFRSLQIAETEKLT